MDLERNPVLQIRGNGGGLGMLSYLHHLRPILDNQVQFWRGLGDNNGAVANMASEIDHGCIAKGGPVKSSSM